MFSGTIFGISFAITGDEESRLQAYCANYIKLQEHCMELNEEDLLRSIIIEKKGRNRANILNRLYARYGNLRSRREKLELFV